MGLLDSLKPKDSGAPADNGSGQSEAQEDLVRKAVRAFRNAKDDAEAEEALEGAIDLLVARRESKR